MKNRIRLTFVVITLAIISIQCTDETPITERYVPSSRFEKRIDKGSSDKAMCVQQTSDGGFILTGCIAQTPSHAERSMLMKLDSDGNEIWTKTFDGTGGPARSVLQTHDGGFLLAGEGVIRTDAQGNELWRKKYYTDNWMYILDMKPEADGGFSLTGNSWVGGEATVYLLKIDAAGNLEWTLEQFSNGLISGGWKLSTVPDGDKYFLRSSRKFITPKYLHSNYIDRVSPSGELLSEIRFGPDSYFVPVHVLPISGNRFIVTGSTYRSETDRRELYVGIYDVKGNMRTDTTLAFQASAQGIEIVRANDGGFFILGEVGSDRGGVSAEDACLIKVDPEGKILWQKVYQHSGDNKLKSIVLTNDGNIVMVGYFRPSDQIVTDIDIWLMKTDLNGDIR